METKKKLTYRQQLSLTDLTEMQDFTQKSIDHVVNDGITDELRYTGFQATKTSATEAQLASGRVFKAGAVHARNVVAVQNLTAYLPAATEKIVAIAASLAEVDNDPEPIKVVIDTETRQVETQSHPTETSRNVTLSHHSGTESAAPQKPTVDAELLVICWVWLDPTGITKIEMNEAGRLPSVKGNDQRVKALESWRSEISQNVETIGTDVNSLASGLRQSGDKRLVSEIASDLARVKEALELEDGYSSYGADRFLDTDETDTLDVNYLAKVEEGIRFSDANADVEQLALSNVYNNTVVISDSFLMAKYDTVPRIVVGNPTGSLPISQYAFQTVEYEQKTISRTRIRYGSSFTVCTNSAWYRSAGYDATRQIFYRGGDTFQKLGQNGKWVRLRRFWYDTYNEVYWDRIVTDHSVNGSVCAQTFLNSQDMWVTKLKLRFDQVGPNGDVTILMAETSTNGKPDLSKVIKTVTLTHANIVQGPDYTEIDWPATFLEKGAHYSLVFITGGDHYLATTSGENYGQGTFFYSTDGVFFQGDLETDVCFELHAAQFKNSRLEVELNALNLDGGMSDIDILADMVVPDGTQIQFEIQPQGGSWTPLEEVESGNTALFGLPPLVNFRAVLIGTKDVMPAIDLANSYATMSRPRTTGRHISQPITLAAPTQDFKVVMKLEEYYEANHDFTMVLNDVTNGLTAVAPATITDRDLGQGDDANHRTIERTFTWTATELPVATSEVVLDCAFSTSSALDVFHGSERVHLAF